MRINGGSISSYDAANLLKHSYYKTRSDEGDYKIDPELSNEYAQTYTKDGNAYVVHRGTHSFNDWLTNTRLAFGNKNDYRFRAGRNIQEAAEKKYGANNTTTLGHSLGSAIAKEVGANSKEIIALNRPSLPLDIISNRKLPDNLYDVRTSFDPVSALRGFEKGNLETLQSKSWNPIFEHSTERITENPETIYGSGLNLQNGLDNKQINSMLSNIKSYNGCYMRDQLPRNIKNGFYIINMEPNSAHGSGTHWVSFYIGSRILIYFDSFGVEPPNDVLALCKHRVLFWNKKTIQASTSTACGWFSIAFILICGKNQKVLNNYHHFIGLFSDIQSRNDEILEEILEKHL
jgi:hypothetical protein